MRPTPAPDTAPSEALARSLSPASRFASTDTRSAVAPESAPAAAASHWPSAFVPDPPHVFELSGTVVDGDDLPVEGADVYVGPLGHPLNRMGSTEADGSFRFRWRGHAQRMPVAVRINDGRRPLSGLRRIDLESGTPRPLRFTVKQSFVVSFTSVEGSLGSLGQAEFRISPALSGFRPGADAPDALLDEAGFHHFVEARDGTGCPRTEELVENVATLTSQVAALSGSLQAVRATRNRDLVEAFELADSGPPTARIEGTVVDARGAPVPNALVARLTEEGAVLEKTRTDDQGRYVFEDVPPGLQQLRAGGGDRGRASETLEVLAADDLRWDAALDRGAELRGRLVDSAGEALVGWRVVALALDPGDGWSDVAMSGPGGLFTIPNAPAVGMQLLAAPDELAAPILVEEGLWPEVLPTGGPQDFPPGEFPLGLGEIVVDDAKAPLASLAFEVQDAEGNAIPTATARLWHATTGAGIEIGVDEDGRFRLPKVPAGRYDLEVGLPGHGWKSLDGLWIAAGAEVDLGVLALPSPAVLRIATAAGPADSELGLQVWHERHDVRTRSRRFRPEDPDLGPPALLLQAGEYLAMAGSPRVRGLSRVRLAPGEMRRVEARLGAGTVHWAEAALSPNEHQALREAFQGEMQSCGTCHVSGGRGIAGVRIGNRDVQVARILGSNARASPTASR